MTVNGVQPHKIGPGRQVRMKCRAFDKGPHERQNIPRVVGHCRAEKMVTAGGRPDQPKQQGDRGGLTCPVRAKKAVDGPAWHQEVDGIDRDLLMEPFGQPIGGNGEVAQFPGHLAASAAYRPFGVTAPTTRWPSSVSNAEKTVPAMRCPEPQLPKTSGRRLTYFISWVMVLAVVLPVLALGPVVEPGAGIFTTTTLSQPWPTTLGMSADCVCGATVLVLAPAAAFRPVGVFSLVTAVPGGGLKVNCAASGRAKSTELNPTSNTGSVTDLAKT